MGRDTGLCQSLLNLGIRGPLIALTLHFETRPKPRQQRREQHATTRYNSDRDDTFYTHDARLMTDTIPLETSRVYRLTVNIYSQITQEIWAPLW